VLLALGEAGKALPYLEQALAVYQKLGRRKGAFGRTTLLLAGVLWRRLAGG
jgi:hypothetical protein